MFCLFSQTIIRSDVKNVAKVSTATTLWMVIWTDTKVRDSSWCWIFTLRGPAQARFCEIHAILKNWVAVVSSDLKPHACVKCGKAFYHITNMQRHFRYCNPSKQEKVQQKVREKCWHFERNSKLKQYHPLHVPPVYFLLCVVLFNFIWFTERRESHLRVLRKVAANSWWTSAPHEQTHRKVSLSLQTVRQGLQQQHASERAHWLAPERQGEGSVGLSSCPGCHSVHLCPPTLSVQNRSLEPDSAGLCCFRGTCVSTAEKASGTNPTWIAMSRTATPAINRRTVAAVSLAISAGKLSRGKSRSPSTRWRSIPLWSSSAPSATRNTTVGGRCSGTGQSRLVLEEASPRNRAGKPRRKKPHLKSPSCSCYSLSRVTFSLVLRAAFCLPCRVCSIWTSLSSSCSFSRPKATCFPQTQSCRLPRWQCWKHWAHRKSWILMAPTWLRWLPIRTAQLQRRTVKPGKTWNNTQLYPFSENSFVRGHVWFDAFEWLFFFSKEWLI